MGISSLFISCNRRPCHHGQKSKALQPCRDFVRACNTKIIFHRRFFSTAQFFSGQGLSHSLLVPAKTRALEIGHRCMTILSVAPNCKLQAIRNTERQTTENHVIMLLINKVMSCQSSRLSSILYFTAVRVEYFCPPRTMFLEMASRVHSGPIFAVAPDVHQASLANCNA